MEERLLKFLKEADEIAHVTEPFWALAAEMCDKLSASPERTVMLRKLIEAKDCAARAWRDQQEQQK